MPRHRGWFSASSKLAHELLLVEQLFVERFTLAEQLAYLVSHGFQRSCVLRLADQVVPFVRIVRVIVEFFRSICIANIAVSIATQRNIPFVKGGQHSPIGRELWVAQQRYQRLTIELCWTRYMAEVN